MTRRTSEKKGTSNRTARVVAGVIVVLIPLVVYADDSWVTLQNGTPADANDVMTNFNNLDDRIGSYESAIHVDGDGNVGIGTTGPDERLDVDGNIRASILYTTTGLGSTIGENVSAGYNVTAGKVINLRPSDSNGVIEHLPETGNLYLRALDGDDVSGDVVIQDLGGNVGIGTTSPVYALDVVGTVHADAFSDTSDIRLKTDIAPLEDALGSVQCLDAVTYRWADPEKPQDTQIGLIAQEVERCFPEVVSTDKQGYKSVAYARLVAPLAEAIKAQQGKISAQQQKIADQQVLIEEQQRALAGQQDVISQQQDEIARLIAKQAQTEARLARIEALLNTARQ